MPKSPPLDRTLTLSAAASHVGATRDTIYKALARGELTPHHDASGPDGPARVEVGELERWAKGRRFGEVGGVRR